MIEGNVYEFPCGITFTAQENTERVVRTVGTLIKGHEESIRYGPGNSMRCALCDLRECTIYGADINCIARLKRTPSGELLLDAKLYERRRVYAQAFNRLARSEEWEDKYGKEVVMGVILGSFGYDLTDEEFEELLKAAYKEAHGCDKT